MSDLTESLSYYAKKCDVENWADAMGKAADRIEELEAELRTTRLAALAEAREAIKALQRSCLDTPEGQTAWMIYGHAMAAINPLIVQTKSDTLLTKGKSAS